jgi:hypothetical protein
VVDCWKAYCHHFKQCSYTSVEFNDLLAYALLHNKYDKSLSEAPEMISPLRMEDERRTTSQRLESNVVPRILCTNLTGDKVISPITTRDTRSMTPRALWHHFRKLHRMEKTELFGADGKTRRRICRECRNKTSWTCMKCKIPVCIDNQGARSDLCHSNHICFASPSSQMLG